MSVRFDLFSLTCRPHKVVFVSRNNRETKVPSLLNDLGVGSVLRQINLRDRSCETMMQTYSVSAPCILRAYFCQISYRNRPGGQPP
jgi:hypothetical protein